MTRRDAGEVGALSPALARWLAAAQADAEQRALPALKPLLRGLADSTSMLRAASWSPSADAPASEPQQHDARVART